MPAYFQVNIVNPGLEFLPTSEESAACRGFSDASVVSISVDHQVKFYSSNLKSFNVWIQPV
jgi:hypothetical protein